MKYAIWSLIFYFLLGVNSKDAANIVLLRVRCLHYIFIYVFTRVTYIRILQSVYQWRKLKALGVWIKIISKE